MSKRESINLENQKDPPFDGYAVAAGLAAIALSVSHIDEKRSSATNYRKTLLHLLETHFEQLKGASGMKFSPEQINDIQRMRNLLVNYLHSEVVLALDGPSGSG